MTWNDLNFIDPIVKSAESLGGLTPAAIFAFMWLWQAINNVRRDNRDSAMNDKSIEARLAIAQAMQAMAEKTEETSDRVERLEVIVSERLPRKAI